MTQPKRIEWLHSVPAILAVALGLVYGTGAVSIYGQIKDAGINGVQAMAVVPLDQILSRGIGRMVSQFGQAVVMVALLAASVYFGYLGRGDADTAAESRDESAERPSRVQRFFDSPKTWATITVAVFGLLLLGLPMKESLSYILSAFLSAGVFISMWRLTGARREHGPRRITFVYVVTGLTFLASYSFASAFLRPSPLPHVRISTQTGEVKGGLIAQDGGSWYIVQDNHSVLAITTRRTRRAYVTYPSRTPEQSVIDWVLERPPSAPLGGPRDE